MLIWIALALALGGLTAFTRRRVTDGTNVLLGAVAVTLILGIPYAWLAGLSGPPSADMQIVIVVWQSIAAALTLVSGLSAVRDLWNSRRRDVGYPFHNLSAGEQKSEDRQGEVQDANAWTRCRPRRCEQPLPQPRIAR